MRGSGSPCPLPFFSGCFELMPATPMSKAEREPGHAHSQASRVFDLSVHSLRELNQALHKLTPGSNETAWEVLNPKGSHSVAVGVDQPVSIDVRGSVGYFCAGMNDGAAITVHGSAGPGVGENMMSGTIVIKGDASQYAGATGRGGL